MDEREELFSEAKGYLVDFFIGLSEDAVQTVRSVYTIWDVLGDIGGLIDMFKILAQPLVALSNLLIGSGMARFLLQAIFVK